MSELESHLSDNWVNTNLSDLIVLFSGFAFKSKEYVNNGIPILRMGNVHRDFTIDLNKKKQPFFPENRVDEFKNYLLKPGDMVITLTDLSSTGNFLGTVARLQEGEIALLNQRVSKIILLTDVIDYTFLFYLLQSPKFRNYVISDKTGSIQKNTSHKYIYAFECSFPGINEQKRIVNKIEELFTKLDAGIQELTLAKEKLKIYRQSVLKHAFDGKLTEEWREAHKDEIESNFSSNVQQDDTNSLNFSGLPEIPEEWSWALLGELGELNRGKSKHRPRNDERLFGGKYPFIQTGEVKNSNGLITDYKKTYSDFGLEQSKLWPKGTLCITIAANIAETALLGIDACFPDSVVGFVPNEEICDINYINYFIKNIKNKIQAYAPATAQKNINLTILKKISVPLPPLVEQQLIVNGIEQSYSISENMEQAIDLSILKSQKLRQSILKKAFTGKLVPQDPNDEPAEQLLERIKAQKEKQKPQRKSKQKRLVK